MAPAGEYSKSAELPPDVAGPWLVAYASAAEAQESRQF